VNPNYHVILIHYPLGVFVLGVLLEALSFMWRRSSIRLAARWMILLGALLMLPAATSGIFALRDVQRQNPSGMPAERAAYLSRHVWVMGSATILAILCAVAGLGASNRMREKLRWVLISGLLATVGLLVYGAWFGGETIYRQGTSVSLIAYEPAETQPSDIKPVLRIPAEPKIDFSAPKKTYSTIVSYFLGGPLQAHIIMAGMAFAVALGALGLSLRRRATLCAADAADLEALTATQETGSIKNPPQRVTDDVTVVRTINPGVQIDPDESRLPVARFWLLAAVVIAMVAVGGYWVMAGRDFFLPETFKTEFLENLTKDQIRHAVHIILGVTMVVLALLFAVTAMALPRRATPLMVFGTLLVLAIAAQVWIGIALTFDQTDGNDTKLLYRLHVPDAPKTTSSTGSGMP
jgi:uncharacterized membrane protein